MYRFRLFLVLTFFAIGAAAPVVATPFTSDPPGSANVILIAGCPPGQQAWPSVKRSGEGEARPGCVPILGPQRPQGPRGPSIAADWADCNGSDPARVIAGCTSIINSGGGYIDPRNVPQVLRSRDRGPWIEALQNFLTSQGYDLGTIDGIYGIVTQRALLAFQKSQGSRVSIKQILLSAAQATDLAYAYYNRAGVYLDKGLYDRAIADYDQAIRLKPAYAYAYYNRGYAYADKGDYAKALIDFRDAASLMPSSDPSREKAFTRIAEIEKKLAEKQVVTPAPTPPAVTPQQPGAPNVFTGGGIVVTVLEREIDGQKVAVVSLKGEMKLGDEKYFNQALLTVDSPVVVVSLQGPGGIVETGIKIGRTIWNNQYRTVVEGDFCVSMCAYAWLAGRPRYASPDARIGFHAPWKGDETAAEVSSVGSAVVGGYLADIGFTTAAMAYMTEPGPNDELRFLMATDAARLGIYFEEWRW